MIVFVVLHYKVFEETRKCILSLLKLQGDKRIVIVDNHSPNNSGRKLVEEYKNMPEVKVIITQYNLGFACGNNIGYQFAKKYNPDFIVVMNNDMEIVDPHFIEGIGRCYDEYHFNIMAPDVYSTKNDRHQNPDKKAEYTLHELEQIRRALKFKLRFRFLIRLKSLIKQKENRQDKTFISEVRINVPLHGSFYVFDKIFISSHNECFYNKTFMYMESQILYHQAMRDRMLIVYDPRIQVLHHEDVATDNTYSNHYRKAVFTNQCLLKSCEAYIELLEKESNK